MFKLLIQLFQNIVSITGNPFFDFIIYAAIGIVAFKIAFKLTGFVSNCTGNYDSEEMSKFHWIVRFIVFIFLVILGIVIVNFISEYIGHLIFGAFFILGIANKEKIFK